MPICRGGQVQFMRITLAEVLLAAIFLLLLVVAISDDITF